MAICQFKPMLLYAPYAPFLYLVIFVFKINFYRNLLHLLCFVFSFCKITAVLHFR